MHGKDEFGNNRLLAIGFAILFATLGLGMIATSETMWDVPVAGRADHNR